MPAGLPLNEVTHHALPLLRFAGARAVGRKHPLMATLCLTDRCNFRCEYCKVPSLDREEMTADEWIDAIDQLHAAGLVRVSLMGGEPLVFKDIGRVITHLRSLHINVSMNTNGWFVPQRIDAVAGLDMICVTLDGPPEVHDVQRHPGSHHRALEAIDAARSRGVKVVTMTVLTPRGLRTVDYVLDVARRLGTRAYFQLQHAEDGNPNGAIGAGLTESHIAEIARHLLQRKEEGWPVGASRAYLHALATGARRLLSCRTCHASRYFLAISPTGDLTPCPMTYRQSVTFNGRKRGFVQAFEEMVQPTDGGCSCYPLTELNYMLDLRGEPWRNAIATL